eukprot:TRINITY_DN2438_c0_g1_i1.p1 TRINITY_DN2438_c0_g1~~TRINITY_DN2438_c0_g1_i1.p1  ORF type:complete len:505 (+),score=51.27 TRINITY_DN2438_c0_g1_i1:48-1562(+)
MRPSRVVHVATPAIQRPRAGSLLAKLDPPNTNDQDKPGKVSRPRRHSLAEPARIPTEPAVLPGPSSHNPRQVQESLPALPRQPIWPPNDTLFLKHKGKPKLKKPGKAHSRNGSRATTPEKVIQPPHRPELEPESEQPFNQTCSDTGNISVHSADLSLFDRPLEEDAHIVVRPTQRNSETPPAIALRLPPVLNSNVLPSLDLSAVMLRDVVVTCSPLPLLTVPAHAPFWEAFAVLRRSQGSSVGVVDGQGQYVDLVDTVDLIKMLLHTQQRTPGSRRFTSSQPTLQQMLLRIDHPPPEAVLHIPLRTKLLTALRTWLTDNRLDCIVGSPPLIAESLLSPLSVLHFFLLHQSLIGEIANRSLQSLGLLQGLVYTVRDETPALHALRQLVDKSVSALPVIDDNGALVGSFDASAVRFIASDTLESLEMPINRFISVVQVIAEGHCNLPVVHQHASPDQTFLQAISQLVNNKAPRLYIVSPEVKPLGVVTPKDILRLLLSELYPSKRK